MLGPLLSEGMKEKENKVHDLRELQKHEMGLFSTSYHLPLVAFKLNLYPAYFVFFADMRRN